MTNMPSQSTSGDLIPPRSDTERRLLGAARQLATEGGYEAVTIQAVADLAGVSRVTAYKYFRNKDHLLSDLIFEWGAEAIAALEQENLETADPAERVARRLCFVIGFLRRAPRLLSAVLSAAAAPGGRASATSATVLRHYMGIDLSSRGELEAIILTRTFGYLLHSMMLALSAERISMAEMEQDMLYLARKLLN